MVRLKIKGLKVSKLMRELAKEGRTARVAKVRKANRTPRPPNQWQRNLKEWNAGNSGWCIPMKGTPDYEKVLHWHTRQRLVTDAPPTPSRRAAFYDAPTPEQLTAEVSHEAIAKLRADLNALKQRQTDLAANRRATIV